MADLADYMAFKTKVEQLQRDVDKAAGALEQSMMALRAYNCNTLEEAQVLLESLKQENKEAKTEFERALTEFEREWDERKNSKNNTEN